MFYTNHDETYYILLNNNVVTVGGTAQAGNWDTTVNPGDSKRIWENCTTLCPALKYGTILRTAVGLRPGRPTIRLESELLEICGKATPVVHNYGHGGSGLTFFYGCSKETAQLAKEAAHRPARSML